MHAMGGVIDMRRFGGLRRLMPITCWTFFIGCLALAGLLPFSGFWSKDEILAAVHHRAAESEGLAANWYLVLYWVGMITAGMTAFYTFARFSCRSSANSVFLTKPAIMPMNRRRP